MVEVWGPGRGEGRRGGGGGGGEEGEKGLVTQYKLMYATSYIMGHTLKLKMGSVTI